MRVCVWAFSSSLSLALLFRNYFTHSRIVFAVLFCFVSLANIYYWFYSIVSLSFCIARYLNASYVLWSCSAVFLFLFVFMRIVIIHSAVIHWRNTTEFFFEQWLYFKRFNRLPLAFRSFICSLIILLLCSSFHFRTKNALFMCENVCRLVLIVLIFGFVEFGEFGFTRKTAIKTKSSAAHQIVSSQ